MAGLANQVRHGPAGQNALDLSLADPQAISDRALRPGGAIDQPVKQTDDLRRR
jgi:hypothetical protein